MERKLIKQGRNALTVTLPAKWCDARKLEAGDVVHIEEENTQLIVSAQRLAKEKTYEIILDEQHSPLYWHTIIAAYIEGYDTITIYHAKKPAQAQRTRLIGMVTTISNASKTVFESIVREPEDRIDSLIRRAGHQFKALAQAQLAVTKKELSLEDLREQEQLLDDTIMYCMRFLNKYEDRQHAYRYFSLLALLEQAGDALRKIAKFNTDVAVAKNVLKATDSYLKGLFEKDILTPYKELRKLRNSVDGGKTFVEGLVFAYAETLYNYLAYQIGIE